MFDDVVVDVDVNDDGGGGGGGDFNSFCCFFFFFKKEKKRQIFKIDFFQSINILLVIVDILDKLFEQHQHGPIVVVDITKLDDIVD